MKLRRRNGVFTLVLNSNIIRFIIFDFKQFFSEGGLRTNVVCALADIVATKLGSIGANVVHAHARCACEGGRSGN